MSTKGCASESMLGNVLITTLGLRSSKLYMAPSLICWHQNLLGARATVKKGSPRAKTCKKALAKRYSYKDPPMLKSNF